jgi:hypothetical protein
MQPWAQFVDEDWWLGDPIQVAERLETEGALLAPPVIRPLDGGPYEATFSDRDLAEDILLTCLEIKANTVGMMFAVAIANWISACDADDHAALIIILPEPIVESVVQHLPVDVLGSVIHKARDWQVPIIPLNSVGNRFITMCRVMQTHFGIVKS